MVEFGGRPRHLGRDHSQSVQVLLPSALTARPTRHLTPVQREELVTRRRNAAELRQEGKSTRQISDDLGVSETTVRRDLQVASPASFDDAGDAITGKDGKEYPAAQPVITAAQRWQRRAETARLRAEGKSLQEIGTTLGVSKEQIRRDLARTEQPEPQPSGVPPRATRNWWRPGTPPASSPVRSSWPTGSRPHRPAASTPAFAGGPPGRAAGLRRTAAWVSARSVPANARTACPPDGQPLHHVPNPGTRPYG